MFTLTRRHMLGGLGAAAGAGLLPGLGGGGRAVAAAAGDSLTINAMPATPSVVVAHMIDSDYLAPHIAKAAMKVWRTPDQMRAGVLSGEMTVFGTPSYSCANLRNRGVPVRQMNILTWGLLYVMTREGGITRVEDLAGKSVLLSFRNDAPDLIFRLVLRRAGLDPDKDLTLSYVGTPTEAVQLFLAGRTDIAVLSEPAATAAQMRGMQAGVTAHRAIDLTEAYATLSGRPPGIPQAGLGITDDLLQRRPELVAAIHQGCVESARWVLNNPASAGRLGADYLELQPPIIERSLPHFRLRVTSAAEAREALGHYFSDLMEMSPDIMGGRMPDDDFYWGA